MTIAEIKFSMDYAQGKAEQYKRMISSIQSPAGRMNPSAKPTQEDIDSVDKYRKEIIKYEQLYNRLEAYLEEEINNDLNLLK